MTQAAEADDLSRLNAATSQLEPPFAVIDLADPRSNAADMTRRAAGTPIRLASKSVRGRRLIDDTLAMAGFRGIAAIEFVNGGGTGSIGTTAAEPAVTEVGAGSGLYQPSLFDAYRSFSGQPTALFALPVVRRPGPGVVTMLGGGYLACGPGDASRLPCPYLPAGLKLDGKEGAGEVQTPLLGAACDGLRIGDRVWFRHAEAGELCERFNELHLIDGDAVTTTVPTYRGEGKAFL